MILNLTIENLLKSGCNTDEANKLFNTSENYTLQCNNGNFYVSKPDNRFYTGIDFYRMIYFNIEGLRFPYNCPDLVNEYFGLALIEFLEKQKTILGLLFNEKDQFNKFISIEIERTQKRIESQKEFLLKMKYHKFESKENDIQICESYINYLMAKESPFLFAGFYDIETNEPQQNQTDEVTSFTKNNFDHVPPKKVYDYFKKELVDTGYLSLEDLEKYLIVAFQDKTVPAERFTITYNRSSTPTKIKKIFYKYYEKIAQDKHGKMKYYCGLLGEYFNGFNTDKISRNFNK
ncbi:hypothetical protein AAIP55_001312 [Flavobacterium psychrophilum]|nr:hypothetical protein [Flavobacterium psychrophilum]EKT4517228.1 hypothetical protein [Flavobacterium psychrophilum]